MVSALSFRPAHDRDFASSSPSRSPQNWRRNCQKNLGPLGVALVVSGFVLQLGALPAAARSSQSVIQTVQASEIMEAIAPAAGNVDSNDNVPRRGDPRASR